MQLSQQELSVNLEIKERFFMAMRHIIARPEKYGIKNMLAFSTAIGWAQPNMYRAQKWPERGIPARYLVAIVKIYGINAYWLLTGIGNMWQDSSA